MELFCIIFSFNAKLFICLYFNYIDKCRYGKFEEIAEIDNQISRVLFEYEPSTSLIEINLPHFWSRAGIICNKLIIFIIIRERHINFYNTAFDPDFSILFDKNSAEEGCLSASKSNYNAGTLLKYICVFL